MCKAVTLKSDSFHLVIVFYFTLYLFFGSLWNSDYLERPSKASLVLLCHAEWCVFKLFLKLQLSIVTDTMLDAMLEIKFVFVLSSLKIFLFFLLISCFDKKNSTSYIFFMFGRKEKLYFHDLNSVAFIFSEAQFYKKRHKMLSRGKPVATDWWQIVPVPAYIVSRWLFWLRGTFYDLKLQTAIK